MKRPPPGALPRRPASTSSSSPAISAARKGCWWRSCAATPSPSWRGSAPPIRRPRGWRKRSPAFWPRPIFRRSANALRDWRWGARWSTPMSPTPSMRCARSATRRCWSNACARIAPAAPSTARSTWSWRPMPWCICAWAWPPTAACCSALARSGWRPSWPAPPPSLHAAWLRPALRHSLPPARRAGTPAADHHWRNTMGDFPRIRDFDDPAYDPFLADEAMFGDTADPYPKLAELRARAAVHEGDYRVLMGCYPDVTLGHLQHYTVVGYDEVAQVLNDPATYSNAGYRLNLGITFGRSISTMD